MTTTPHPSSLDLEAFACGETIAKVHAHLSDCAACEAFVEQVRSALSRGPSKTKAADAVARAAAKIAAAETASSPIEERSADRRAAPKAKPSPLAPPVRSIETARRRLLMNASTLAVPLAAAAALLFFLRTPSTKDAFVPGLPTATTSSTANPSANAPIPVPSTNSDPETTFKGGIQIAVIRERGGQQTRFTDTVPVRPGDRLRVEVALDREQAILAAVLGDDASWLELMSVGVRRSGTHFSEHSARIDATPTHGTILVGTPEAVSMARETRRLDGVSTVRVEWEGTSP